MLFYLLWSVPLLSRSVIFPLPIRSLVSCDLPSHSCPSSPRLLFLHYRSVVLPLAVCNRIAVPPLPVCCFFSPDPLSHFSRSAVSQLSLLFPFAVSSLPIRCLTSCGLQSHSCPAFPVCCFFSPDPLSHFLRSAVSQLSLLFPFAVPSSLRCGLFFFNPPS